MGEWSVDSSKLAPGAVGFEQLADRSVGSGKLQDESVNSDHLAAGAVTFDKLAPEVGGLLTDLSGALRTTKLRLAQEPIQPEPPAAPMLAVASAVPGVGLTFGHVDYAFGGIEDRIEVSVSFDAPYADDAYVVFAMADHPGCVCTLKEKSPEKATFDVCRTRLTPAPNGRIQWMAVGLKSN
ncbi:WIAG-tail domain [Cohnella ginsengisoli]|uniref:WIAG-tail domain n=1 Tax=Cohnella ginsengisoli TaxID=425004 RepID=A0A9X4KI95_9BACL|nr:WIAG-tail domain [Cohnella ginsengisoli]MDG0790592.1 WIAG-tail domain [Cohnella ginsengisoli]